jgi:HSP20 family protein
MNGYNYMNMAWGLLDEVLNAFEQDVQSAPLLREWRPRINAWESDQTLVLEAELPGVEPGQVEVSIEGAVLTLQGKPDKADKTDKCPQFARQLRLPFAVEVDAVKASFANGILTLNLPKAAAAKRRLIAVGAV